MLRKSCTYCGRSLAGMEDLQHQHRSSFLTCYILDSFPPSVIINIMQFSQVIILASIATLGVASPVPKVSIADIPKWFVFNPTSLRGDYC
jgi:hypothetical protein